MTRRRDKDGILMSGQTCVQLAYLSIEDRLRTAIFIKDYTEKN